MTTTVASTIMTFYLYVDTNNLSTEEGEDAKSADSGPPHPVADIFSRLSRAFKIADNEEDEMTAPASDLKWHPSAVSDLSYRLSQVFADASDDEDESDCMITSRKPIVESDNIKWHPRRMGGLCSRLSQVFADASDDEEAECVDSAMDYTDIKWHPERVGNLCSRLSRVFAEASDDDEDEDECLVEVNDASTADLNIKWHPQRVGDLCSRLSRVFAETSDDDDDADTFFKPRDLRDEVIKPLAADLDIKWSPRRLSNLSLRLSRIFDDDEEDADFECASTTDDFCNESIESVESPCSAVDGPCSIDSDIKWHPRPVSDMFSRLARVFVLQDDDDDGDVASIEYAHSDDEISVVDGYGLCTKRRALLDLHTPRKPRAAKCAASEDGSTSAGTISDSEGDESWADSPVLASSSKLSARSLPAFTLS